jgi:hypothetical protein
MQSSTPDNSGKHSHVYSICRESMYALEHVETFTPSLVVTTWCASTVCVVKFCMNLMNMSTVRQLPYWHGLRRRRHNVLVRYILHAWLKTLVLCMHMHTCTQESVSADMDCPCSRG